MRVRIGRWWSGLSLRGKVIIAVAVLLLLGAVAQKPATSPTAAQETPAPTTMTAAPSAAATPAASQLPFAIVAPRNGATVTTQVAAVAGTGPGGAQIVRPISFAPDQSVNVSADGTWSMQVPLSPGTNSLQFRVGDDESTTIRLALVFNPPVTPAPTATTPVASPAPTDSGSLLGPSIPGLTAAAIKTVLVGMGMKCTGPKALGGGVTYACTDSRDPTVEPDVEWFGDDANDVRVISAGMFWLGTGSGEARFDAFFGKVATIPYTGATPSAARAWVVKAKPGDVHTFGGATFEIGVGSTPVARLLRITGVGG